MSFDRRAGNGSAGLITLVPAASTQNDRGAVSPATGINSRFARLEQQTTEAKSAPDIAWMLTSSALVLMMTGPGLARKKVRRR